MIMEFIFLIIVIVVACALKFSVKLKIEQSIFVAFCSLFIIELFSGLIFDLQIGYYIIISLSIISFIYLVYIACKKRFILKEIITPGFILFLLSFVVYYFSSKGAMLHLYDEATHWGTVAKSMYHKNELWTTGLQSIASPVFNYVMLKTVGYSESAIYLSQWVLGIACIILPLSNITWKKSFLATIYFIGVVLALSVILAYGNLTLYADGLLALFFGSMINAWYLAKKASNKKYIWACSGLFMLVQLKSGTGLSLAIMFLIFAMIIDTKIRANQIDLRMKTKHTLKNILIFSIIIAASHLLMQNFNNKFIADIVTESQPIGNSISLLQYSILGVLAILIVVFVAYILLVFKKSDKLKWFRILKIITIVLIIIVLVLSCFLLFNTIRNRADFDAATVTRNFISALLNFKIIATLTIIIGLSIMNLLFTTKVNRRAYSIFYSVSIVICLLYIFGMLYSYLTQFVLHEAIIVASFNRYISTALIFTFILSLLPLIDAVKQTSKRDLFVKIILSLTIIGLLTQWTPTYKVVEQTKKEAIETRKSQDVMATYIKSIVKEDERVFVVVQDDTGIVFNWMRYELVPITTNGGYWCFDNGGNTCFWDRKLLKEYMRDYNYSYLYIHNLNDVFIGRFKRMFIDDSPNNQTLYKFTYSEDLIVFTAIN